MKIFGIDITRPYSIAKDIMAVLEWVEQRQAKATVRETAVDVDVVPQDEWESEEVTPNE